ncbi:FAD-binding oxidoreductase [Botrimarina sp.]|uniref:NAD(P)/FAD-dependent oxidoreductase n=1 Tax=Botrimarina sp. TaxID=2795802 RepID=UPI0032ED229A
MVIEVDVLVIGQGLAGSTLVWRLAERGLSTLVVDRGGVDPWGRASSSRVAAGLVTPVTGKRLTLADDFAELWDDARRFYRRVERATRSTLLDEAPAVRLFVDETERGLFHSRLAAGEYGEHARPADPHELPAGLAAPFGGFVMPSAARLRVADFLLATRGSLAAEDRYIKADADPSELCFQSDRVLLERYGVAGRRAVLCQGYAPSQPPWLGGPTLAPAKGEVLTIESASHGDDRVVHRGVWIAPEGPGGYRVGATTDHDRIDSEPTEEGRAELLGRLAEAGLTDARVTDHSAAVRPATPDRRPTFGFSERQPRAAWLNGLGAKGVLWAPTYADRLAEQVARSLGSP